MQLNLFEWEVLTDAEKQAAFNSIRASYWFIRNSRAGRIGQAIRRRYYRKVADQKKRLQLAGVEKREILDLVACCRLQCRARKQPPQSCKYCSQYAQ
jgi:hypothetical protein